MKKQILLLAACSVFVLASCGSNSANSSQAQIDSTVNVKVGQQEAAMAGKNDSTINALAKAKADSMEIEKKKEVGERRHEGHANNNYNNNNGGGAAPAQTPTMSAQDAKFQNRQGTNGTTPTQTPAQQQAQDNKFNSRK